MASFNIVFTNRGSQDFHLSGEVDLVGWELHIREHYSNLMCRSTIDKLYRMQADKGKAGFENIQRKRLQKLLSYLSQSEGQVSHAAAILKYSL